MTRFPALKRFIARRGVPEYLYSDNGTGLMGTKRTLSEFKDIFIQKWGEQNASSTCSGPWLNWQAIPPSGPHMGGNLGSRSEIGEGSFEENVRENDSHIHTTADSHV